MPTANDKYRARAVRLLAAGSFVAAAEQLRRNVQANPASLDDRVLLAQALVQSGRPAEAEAELRAVLEQAPGTADVHACLGQVLARTDRRVLAVAEFERALALLPGHWCGPELTALKGAISQSIHSWHLPMLADTARNDAFQAAIAAAVRPDDLVLDIGAGTGLLAMMAARAGATEVVACEMLPDMAELARLVIAENGYADRIRVVGKPSTALKVGVDLPRRATLLIAEIFDALLIGEGALDTFAHAQADLLAPGARIIPAGGLVRGQLAALPRLKTMHPLASLSGFDLSGFARHATEKQFYPVQLEAESWTPLSEPVTLLGFDFAKPNPIRQDWRLDIPAVRDGTVDALVLWLELQLDEQVRISSGPGGTLRHWNPVVFLFDTQRDVVAGDVVEVRARMGDNVFYFAM